MSRWLRFVRFNAVGALGIAVQLATLWWLTAVLGVHYAPATVAAVAAAVAHNFAWHRRWTWGDRCGTGWMAQLLRFAAANGAVSLLGNVSVMVALVSGAHVHPVAANGVAIGISGVLNFWLSDAVVFD